MTARRTTSRCRTGTRGRQFFELFAGRDSQWFWQAPRVTRVRSDGTASVVELHAVGFPHQRNLGHDVNEKFVELSRR